MLCQSYDETQYSKKDVINELVENEPEEVKAILAKYFTKNIKELNGWKKWFNNGG